MKSISDTSERAEMIRRPVFTVLGPLSQFPERTVRTFTLDEMSVGIVCANGEVFGFINRCPHQGGPVCEGELSGSIESRRAGEYNYDPQALVLRCPWHGWEFRLTDGTCTIPRHNVKIPRLKVQATRLDVLRREAESSGATLAFAHDCGNLPEGIMVVALRQHLPSHA